MGSSQALDGPPWMMSHRSVILCSVDQHFALLSCGFLKILRFYPWKYFLSTPESQNIDNKILKIIFNRYICVIKLYLIIFHSCVTKSFPHIRLGVSRHLCAKVNKYVINVYDLLIRSSWDSSLKIIYSITCRISPCTSNFARNPLESPLDIKWSKCTLNIGYHRKTLVLK